MFKHITLCLILASTLNCLYIKKWKHAKIACKRAEELTKDIQKLDNDKVAYQTTNHNEVHSLKQQIEELKRKIAAKENDLQKYLVAYEKNKFTKAEELKKQQKICQDRKILGAVIGQSRNLGKDDCSASSSKTGKKSHHGPKHGNYNAWAKNEHTKAKIDARGAAQSFGKGESSAVAGPNGSQVTAKGTQGAKTGSSFQADINKKGSNWGVDSSKGHRNTWGTTFANDSKVDARGKAQGFGNATVGSRTGLEGSENFAHGSKGTKTDASWKGNNDRKENSWGAAHKF
jgi:hypothetical protein